MATTETINIITLETGERETVLLDLFTDAIEIVTPTFVVGEGK